MRSMFYCPKRDKYRITLFSSSMGPRNWSSLTVLQVITLYKPGLSLYTNIMRSGEYKKKINGTNNFNSTFFMRLVVICNNSLRNIRFSEYFRGHVLRAHYYVHTVHSQTEKKRKQHWIRQLDSRFVKNEKIRYKTYKTIFRNYYKINLTTVGDAMYGGRGRRTRKTIDFFLLKFNPVFDERIIYANKKFAHWKLPGEIKNIIHVHTERRGKKRKERERV